MSTLKHIFNRCPLVRMTIRCHHWINHHFVRDWTQQLIGSNITNDTRAFLFRILACATYSSHTRLFSFIPPTTLYPVSQRLTQFHSFVSQSPQSTFLFTFHSSHPSVNSFNGGAFPSWSSAALSLPGTFAINHESEKVLPPPTTRPVHHDS